MSSHRKRQKIQQPIEAQAQPLSPENQRLLAFLEEFMKTPDEMGKAWWDEFEKWLRENRLRLRSQKNS